MKGLVYCLSHDCHFDIDRCQTRQLALDDKHLYNGAWRVFQMWCRSYFGPLGPHSRPLYHRQCWANDCTC